MRDPPKSVPRQVIDFYFLLEIPARLKKFIHRFCHISIRMDTRRPCCHLLVGVSDVVIGYTKTNLNEFDILQIRLTNNDSLFTMK